MSHHLRAFTYNLKEIKNCRKSRTMTPWEELLVFKAEVKNKSKFTNDLI